VTVCFLLELARDTAVLVSYRLMNQDN